MLCSFVCNLLSSPYVQGDVQQSSTTEGIVCWVVADSELQEPSCYNHQHTHCKEMLSPPPSYDLQPPLCGRAPYNIDNHQMEYKTVSCDIPSSFVWLSVELTVLPKRFGYYY